ncbi:MAG: diacylglycerol kinase family protein [Bacteroidales bacterium]|nr:diacylglycerol kinase family protein [Bacteroidales bacterium]
MKHQKFSLSNRLKSFSYAFNGLKILIKEEHNARIHLFAAIVVVMAGFIFKISVNEWFVVLLAIGFVMVVEIINTAIESIANIISPEKDKRIKKIKDLSAAAVLISALTALVIGSIIFIPKLLNLICCF